jgi:hypothetical protein
MALRVTITSDVKQPSRLVRARATEADKDGVARGGPMAISEALKPRKTVTQLRNCHVTPPPPPPYVVAGTTQGIFGSGLGYR